MSGDAPDRPSRCPECQHFWYVHRHIEDAVPCECCDPTEPQT